MEAEIDALAIPGWANGTRTGGDEDASKKTNTLTSIVGSGHRD